METSVGLLLYFSDGKVVTGVSGGEAGIRGLVDTYDAKTGQRVWRFWTIPGTGDPECKTWAGDNAKTGGGPTWVTGAYDPELKLVYWGGNPSPDWNGDARLGDNHESPRFRFGVVVKTYWATRLMRGRL